MHERILHINDTPMHKLRFKDFTWLKSGRDEFSNLKLPDLLERVSRGVRQEIESAFPDDESSVARCIRWMLRGLDLDKAMRKVRTDNEVAENAKNQ